MRFLRHAALLLLLLLIAGGPALGAVAQMSCAPQGSHCPMCTHRTEQMGCMGERAVVTQAMQATVAMDDAVVADSACFCKTAPASQVGAVQAAPSSLVDHAPAPVVDAEPAWPPIGKLAGQGVPASVSVERLALRSSVAAPLRV